MKRIAIIGAGWLGLPLAKHLQQLGHWVCASKTTSTGAQELQELGIHSFVCDLDAPQDLDKILVQFQIDTVIGSFPPGFRRGKGDEYIEHWEALANQARQANVEKLVMISSTTVYPERAADLSENDASMALCENSDEFSVNAKRMLRAEQSVIDSGLDYAIVRCSGLIGPLRNPARFAAKLKQVSRLAPANMLHLTDAIGATTFATEHLTKEIVNATTPNTVSKAEFYRSALNVAGSSDKLPPVVDIPDKRVLSDKLINAGYQFHYSHTLEALKNDE